MKVLVLHPDFDDKGGVSAYFTKLKTRYVLPVDHYIVGKRPGERGFLRKVVRLLGDYLKFIKLIKKEKYDIIHVNPSLDHRSFIRDGLFILLARIYRSKTIVFFHGWHESYQEILDHSGRWQFRCLYGKANGFIVLAENFRKRLVEWGCRQPIYQEVIVIEDDIVNRFDVIRTINARVESKTWRILFMSRLIREKGIYETIEAFENLLKNNKQIELIIAGDGDELDNARAYVRKHSIPNVVFVGYVTGEEKYKLLESAHIFCFPSYSEGFPNSIVEAMAFGIPIVTRPVGGIADFFGNGCHGFATASKEPVIIANLIEKLLLDVELYRKISLCNYGYAKENFLASKGAMRLEKIYGSVLGKRD